MKLPFQKKTVQELLIWATLLLALVPILNSSSKCQGWGGDYAGYLLEAKNIAQGKSLQTTEYLYNPHFADLAPPAYPVGFPLLMASVYKVAGLNISAYTKWMGFFWWLLCVGSFLFWRRFFTSGVALIAALLFMYHPLFFFERNSVLSDYPFVVWMLFAVYVYVQPSAESSLKNAVWVGFFAGLAWLTRSVGVIIPFVIAFHFLLENSRQIRTEGWRSVRWQYPAVVLLVSCAMQWVIQHWFFPLPVSGSYLDQLEPNFMAPAKGHLQQYTEALMQYFQLSGDNTRIFGYKNTDTAAAVGGSVALGASILGLISATKPHERFFLALMIAYAAVILVWPSFQGYRFLLPILPFLVYFLLKTLAGFDAGSKWGNYLKWWLIPLLMYGEFNRMDQRIYDYSRNMDPGAPEWEGNQQAFHYVRDSIPAGAVFGFHHPLIFALYAEKPVVRWPKYGTPQEIQADFDQFKLNYLLVNDWLAAADEPLRNYLKENSARLDTVWKNERNVLIKMK